MPWDFWLIFLLLGVVLPWRGRLRLKKLLSTPEITSRERTLLYVSTIAFQWTAVAVTGWRAAVRGLTRDQLGLAVHGPAKIAIAAIVGAATFAILQFLNLRRMGKSSGKAREFMQQLGRRILPQSPPELPVFVLLAATAGICEEFLYRGFAMAALAHTELPVGWIVFISSVLFGLAHLYQGRGGFVGTSLIGVIFGIGRIAYDGLIPVMAWHFAVDVAAGIAGPKYLRDQVPGAMQNSTAISEP